MTLDLTQWPHKASHPSLIIFMPLFSQLSSYVINELFILCFDFNHDSFFSHVCLGMFSSLRIESSILKFVAKTLTWMENTTVVQKFKIWFLSVATTTTTVKLF